MAASSATLTSREWDVETDGEVLSTLVLYQDPSGSLAGGNGATLWDCAIALALWLQHGGAAAWQRRRVLELGAGVGLCSLVLSNLGAAVIASERAIALPLLELNVRSNSQPDHPAAAAAAAAAAEPPMEGAGAAAEDDCGSSGPPPGPATKLSRSLSVLELDWCEAEQHLALAPHAVDVVIGADLIFGSNSTAHAPLVTLLDRFAQGAGGLQPAEVYLAHEPRDAVCDAAIFGPTGLLAERGLNTRRLCGAELPEAVPDDIWILQITPDGGASGQASASATDVGAVADG